MTILIRTRWHQVIAWGIDSAYLFSLAVIPQMAEHGVGAIVQRLCHRDLERRRRNRLDPLAAAKAGVEAMTVGLAKEPAPHRIRVNVVQPGFVATPLHEATASGPSFEGSGDFLIRAAEKVPMGRVADPTEIAEAGCFLAGPAASHVTGAIMKVSGG